MKTFLIIGIDPETIDYSDPKLPPGLTAEKLQAQVDETVRQFASRGDHADVYAVAFDDRADAQVIEQLAIAKYDCVMIGGGIRQPNESVELLERIINAVRLRAECCDRFSQDAERWDRRRRSRLIARLQDAGLLSPSAIS